MTNLEKLYSSIKGFEDLGMTLTEDILKQADEMEEQLIKTEVLPTLSKDIEPLLSQIQRELVLVVEYKPGKPISVSLSRKRNISEILNAKHLDIDPQVEHNEYGPRSSFYEKRAPRTGLCVFRKDGTVIHEHDAATTFTAAIIEAGPMRVRQLELKYCRINIVSTTRDQKYGLSQREIESGVYVLTHSNTRDKKKMLDVISNSLQLGWTVKIIE